jgi:hypothetical protein
MARSDHVARSGTLVFPPGATLRHVDVPVVGDRVEEPSEEFFVNLSAPPSSTTTTCGAGSGREAYFRAASAAS